MQKPIRVIYVDDDPNMATLLPRVLALAGIVVVAICTSAEELLASRGTSTYEAAEAFVTDVQLPHMSGIEMAEKLRAAGETRPILVVSAWTEEFKWGLTEMQVAYLQKPYEFEDLENTIKRLVQEAREE